MAEEEFEIEISAEGKVTIRTKGIKGPPASTWPSFRPDHRPGRSRGKLTSEYYESSEVVQSRIEVHRRNG